MQEPGGDDGKMNQSQLDMIRCLVDRQVPCSHESFDIIVRECDLALVQQAEALVEAAAGQQEPVMAAAAAGLFQVDPDNQEKEDDNMDLTMG